MKTIESASQQTDKLKELYGQVVITALKTCCQSSQVSMALALTWSRDEEIQSILISIRLATKPVLEVWIYSLFLPFAGRVVCIVFYKLRLLQGQCMKLELLVRKVKKGH